MRCPSCRQGEVVVDAMTSASFSLNPFGQLTARSIMTRGAPPVGADPVGLAGRCLHCDRRYDMERTEQTKTLRVKLPKVFVCVVCWHGASPETDAEVVELMLHHGIRQCTCCGDTTGFVTGRGKAQASLLPIARTNAVKRALESDASHILLIDQDTTGFTGEAVLRMAFHDLPIVSAYVCRRSPPYDPVHRYLSPDGTPQAPCPTPHELWKMETGLVEECWGVGMAFTLVKREVFEKIGEPYFRFIPADYEAKNPASGWFHGEDHSLCVLAREKGFKSYVDCGVHLGHVRSTETSVDDWYLANDLAPASPEDMRRLRETFGDPKNIRIQETERKR